jgi:hypothetical protein
MVAKGQGGPSEEEHPGFVPVIMARSPEEAEEYCQLFEDHDIDVVVGDEDLEDRVVKGKIASRPPVGAIPILVAEDMLDEAREVLADREDVEFQLAGDEDDEYDDEDDGEDELDLVIDLEDGDEDLIDEDEDDEEFDEDEDEEEL